MMDDLKEIFPNRTLDEIPSSLDEARVRSMNDADRCGDDGTSLTASYTSIAHNPAPRDEKESSTLARPETIPVHEPGRRTHMYQDTDDLERKKQKSSVVLARPETIPAEEPAYQVTETLKETTDAEITRTLEAQVAGSDLASELIYVDSNAPRSEHAQGNVDEGAFPEVDRPGAVEVSGPNLADGSDRQGSPAAAAVYEGTDQTEQVAIPEAFLVEDDNEPPPDGTVIFAAIQQNQWCGVPRFALVLLAVGVLGIVVAITVGVLAGTGLLSSSDAVSATTSDAVSATTTTPASIAPSRSPAVQTLIPTQVPSQNTSNAFPPFSSEQLGTVSPSPSKNPTEKTSLRPSTLPPTFKPSEKPTAKPTERPSPRPVTLPPTSAPTENPVKWTKLLSNDGKLNGLFGWSVAIDGDTAVVGAPGDDTIRGNSGAVYVFYRTGRTWEQQAKLEDSFGEPFADQYGYSVDLDGSALVFGSMVSGEGNAEVYARTGTEWKRIRTLYPNCGGGLYGFSVALDGGIAVVGQPQSSWAHVFTFYEDSRSIGYELDPNESTFGYSVSASGGTLVVGAPDGSAVFVYTGAGTIWQQQAKLHPEFGVSNRFGASVAIDGDTIVIGAPGDNSAYIFTRSFTSWQQTAKLAPLDIEDVQIDSDFGSSVDIAGDRVVVGAPGGNSAYVYELVLTQTGSKWQQQLNLSPDDSAAGDNFGASVAIDGKSVLVGAHGDAEQGENSGSAYLIDIY